MRLLVGALTVGVVLTLSACGGDDEPDAKPSAPESSATAQISAEPLTPTKPSAGPRPSVGDLRDALVKVENTASGKKYTRAEATCVAEVLLGTDLSDGALNALKANLGTYVPPGAETKIFTDAIPKIQACGK